MIGAGARAKRAIFPNQAETFFPNQFVATKLVVDTLHAATLAPNANPREGAPGSYVYALAPDSTISVRPRQVAFRQSLRNVSKGFCYQFIGRAE